ncbi:MAG: radical SAM protein [Proteobacteria bacterium]|nr:radical SAM protein [Pseudomonadota bacterium]
MNRTFDCLKNDMSFKQHITGIFLGKAFDFRTKHILEIELTNRCSIGCFYCGATTESQSVFLDFDTVCHAITHFSESCQARSIVPHFSVTGGDPLEYPHFERLMTFLKSRKIHFSLKLNPSTLTETIHDMIAEAGCKTVKLTFMGRDSQKTYRKTDTIEKLCNATRRFKADKIPVVWHFSLGEFNREDLLCSLGFVLENQPTAVSVGRLARVGKLNEKNYPMDILPESYKSFLKQMLLYYYNHKRHGFDLVFKDKLWVPFLCEENIISASDLLKPGIRLGCDAKERLLVLTYAGELIRCGLLPEPVLSQIGDMAFFDILGTTTGKPSPIDDAPCMPCKYQPVCRGCKGVAQGSNAMKDPQCWL